MTPFGDLLEAFAFVKKKNAVLVCTVLRRPYLSRSDLTSFVAIRVVKRRLSLVLSGKVHDWVSACACFCENSVRQLCH